MEEVKGFAGLFVDPPIGDVEFMKFSRIRITYLQIYTYAVKLSPIDLN